ncbi:auxin response factor 18-like [Wolffia australiana]
MSISALLRRGEVRGSMIGYRGDYPIEIAMKGGGKRGGLDPQLWHACAGGMVQMPALGSLVCYFPQGQAEHAQGPVEFPSSPLLPAYVLCRVAAVQYLADPDTDEVFAKMKLAPARSEELQYAGEDGLAGPGPPEKSASFAKTLTQSDANNGGGFSVPRYCAETIFPRLDYSADPPVQTIAARDVHGEVWKFRHIYRGTPRRHLLTTGWSTFVNQKKLVAGDSIVFLRADNGELCVGIRRAKRGPAGGLELPSGWNIPGGSCFPPAYAGFSLFLREQEGKLARRGGEAPGSARGARVRPEAVLEAASLAARGQPFEVVYYPRASRPEFCVRAAAVRAALRIDWCAGMRFKMAFETEDSSRISWFMGTVSTVQCADPLRWPDSPWRLLQVTWDEPDLLQNVKRVSPWLVELVASVPGFQLKSFSPQRKKLRLPPSPELEGRALTHVFSGSPYEPSSNPRCGLPDRAPEGIQGARHSPQLGISVSDHLQVSKLQTGLLHAGFHPLRDPSSAPAAAPPPGSPPPSEAVSCVLTIGNASSSPRFSPRASHFLLFGQPIPTERQPGTSPSSGEESELRSPDSGHCKVFLDSENVGRTLDLSVLGSYDELYRRLADMFGIHNSDVRSRHVLYRDATGALKHTGDEAFADFMKTARRLQILNDGESDDVER